MRTSLLLTGTLTAAFWFSQPAFAATPQETARAALAASPIVDGHNDVPEQLRSRFANDFSKFDFRDTHATKTSDAAAMHSDLIRLRAGKVGGQFWSLWVDPALPEAEAVRQVTEQIDTVERLIARYPDDLVHARTAADIEAAFKGQRIASLIGMEGGHSIGSSLAVLRQMYRAGARYMTITHFLTTPWADSATDTPRHGGLAPFGVAVIAEMNRLGMIVDLSHVSEATMNDALDVARAPVMFSHSGARGVDNHPRNVPDGVLARVKINGGIVMLPFVSIYVNQAVWQWDAARLAEEARAASLHIGDPAGAKAAQIAWIKANPVPRATIMQVADHIDHIAKIAGIDHIGIGADFDGTTNLVDGLEDVSTYPALFTELARRGYTKADLEKIASRNMIRVLRGVEATAARMKDVPPSDAVIGK